MTQFRVNLRKTHPLLHYSVLVFAMISMGLGLNFWFTKPTFNPYGIHLGIIGAVFMGLGMSKLLLLLVVQNLMLIRLSMALCAAWMLFWGIGSSITFFTGQTSLQLFIVYFGLALLQWLLSREPHVNLLTSI